MRIYCSEDSLNLEEIDFIKEFLAKCVDKEYINKVEQIRVPGVLPVLKGSIKSDQELIRLIGLVKNNLIKAGVKSDKGSQIV